MKNIRSWSAVLAVSCILFACSSNSSIPASKGDTLNTTSDNSGGSSSTSGASFSCTLDGKNFSGSGTDENINAAFHLTGDNKGQIFFRLSNMNDVGNKLMFEVPAKEGSTIVSASASYSYEGYITSDFANYIDDPITISINSISSSNVSGTFSGKYTLQKGTGNNSSKQTIEVTNGKFDIPFSTSAQWKQMYQAE